MAKRFGAISAKLPVLWHGGDYNPDQWLGQPEVLKEDLRLMKLAGVNVVSLGIFAWAALEPEEGKFTFEWMDRMMDSLEGNGVKVILATPSGAKPNWMAGKYPEIRRVDEAGRRDLQQGRHNHCYTSPVYREKVTVINTKLAERYGEHPALVLWHVSNEYGGACFCDLCKTAFRAFLREKYKTLEALNDAYWARFWSHTYTAWDQIEAIDRGVHGLHLDWMRFITHQTTQFLEVEAAPLRKLTPGVPITINMMGTYYWLNYPEMAEHVDVISWDAYPNWHESGDPYAAAMAVAFRHDLNRSMKQKPYLLMESTPSQTNWAAIPVPKRPGMHKTSSLQAVAHGSEGVLYFQWRKSRGSSEKFHGAVVDHVGHEKTRVFGDVAELGADLKKLSADGGVVGMGTKAEVGIIFDWESMWGIDFSQGPRNKEKEYEVTGHNHYRPFWSAGIPVDVVQSAWADLTKYKLVIAPMLYMLRPGVAAKLKAYVAGGGTLVATYLTGVANQSDLVFAGGLPGDGLMELFGIWAEEVDVLDVEMRQGVTGVQGNGLGLKGPYAARHFAEIVHLRGATAAATYTEQFYAGGPAVTVNAFGKGRAIYVASRNDEAFIADLMGALSGELGIKATIPGVVPPVGVSATYRTDGVKDYVFVLNFNGSEQTVGLDGQAYTDAISGQGVTGKVVLGAFESRVLIRASAP